MIKKCLLWGSVHRSGTALTIAKENNTILIYNLPKIFSHFVQYDNVYKQPVFPLFYFVLRERYRVASYITLEN